jgi:hypothetical protein
MPSRDAETNLLIFKAFLLGKHVALKTFNVTATAAEDDSEQLLQQISEGKMSLVPDAESMLRIVPTDDRDGWKKRFEATRPERVAEEKSLASGALDGMKEYYGIK